MVVGNQNSRRDNRGLRLRPAISKIVLQRMLAFRKVRAGWSSDQTRSVTMVSDPVSGPPNLPTVL